MVNPPYTINKKVLNLCTEISELLGRYEGLSLSTPDIELRKDITIITVQSSLAIEGNTLSTEQVTDILNNKKVKGPKKDIIEAQNALQAYAELKNFQARNIKSLLKAHNILMKNLLKDAGNFRKSNVGVGGKNGVVHVAPKYTMVPQLMENLFQFLNKEKDLHPLILSSIFHYEFEFIHPFLDGNGRLGRLWQSVILYHYNPNFQYIPIETIVKQRQQAYYKAIRSATLKGESSPFIEFMLKAIKTAILQFTKNIKPSSWSVSLRLEAAQKHFAANTKFSRKDYMALHPNLSTATASRDLGIAVKQNLLTKTGEKALTQYYF